MATQNNTLRCFVIPCTLSVKIFFMRGILKRVGSVYMKRILVAEVLLCNKGYTASEGRGIS